MRSETKITVAIFSLAAILALVGLGIKSIDNRNIPLTPFSKNVNIFSLIKHYEKPDHTVYGYLPYWSIEDIEYLQLDKLTDIAYFGIHIKPDGNLKKFVETEEDGLITEPGYNNWINNEDVDKLIRECKKHDVRVALTVVAHVDSESDEFLNCKSCWDTLLVELKEELDAKNITDVNLNFEYVEYTDFETAQKFSEFAKYFNQELDKTYGDSKVVVSAFADSAIRDRISSDLDTLGKFTDGIFIMGYDFHHTLSDNAGPVSPMGGAGTIADYDLTTAVADFISKVPPNKLILGVPYYGYNWVVDEEYYDENNPQISEMYAKRKEGTEEIGFSQSQAYAYIMETILEVDPEILWDEVGQVPYFKYTSPETGSLRTVFYENKDSLRLKYRLANENNFAGVGIWALGYDGGYTELWDLLFEEFIQ